MEVAQKYRRATGKGEEEEEPLGTGVLRSANRGYSNRSSVCVMLAGFSSESKKKERIKMVEPSLCVVKREIWAVWSAVETVLSELCGIFT